MGPMRTGRAAIRLPGSTRLARVLRQGRAGRAKTAYPPAYAEEEVRDRIYGWHSGTVEPPEPADTARVAGRGRLSGRSSSGWRAGDQAPAENDSRHLQRGRGPEEGW